jgi:hypothetical protein
MTKAWKMAAYPNDVKDYELQSYQVIGKQDGDWGELLQDDLERLWDKKVLYDGDVLCEASRDLIWMSRIRERWDSRRGHEH